LKDREEGRYSGRMSQDEVRAGEVESLFRAVNERVAELNARLDPLVEYGSWACECADPSCSLRIDMTQAEYTELREQPTHFAIAPDEKHFDPEVETLVRKTDRFWIVEKRGEAAEIATRARESFPGLDPTS
jgi:hypothetical protein